jgi:hypothetical protein
MTAVQRWRLRLDHQSTKPTIANDCLGDGHRRDGVVVWIGIT